MASGLFYGDFKPGMQMKGSVGRTVTGTGSIWFTLLTNNSNQIHFNADYARKTLSGELFRGRMVVNGCFALATAAGIMLDQTSADGLMLGIGGAKFLKPVFSGDTIYAESEVSDVRESRGNGGSGIAGLKTRGFSQRGEMVVEFERVFVARKRGSARGARRTKGKATRDRLELVRAGASSANAERCRLMKEGAGLGKRFRPFPNLSQSYEAVIVLPSQPCLCVQNPFHVGSLGEAPQVRYGHV